MDISGSAAFGESLPEQIAKNIIGRILKGELRSGDKIVEDELSKQLNISRAPVREAIYLLQMDGIVEKLPRRGTIIKTFSTNEIREYVEVVVGLIDLSFQFSKGRWDANQFSLLSAFMEELNAEFAKRDLITYQKSAQRVLRFIIATANNKALSRFYEESAQILIVFASVHWTEDTMARYHSAMMSFAAAIEESKFEQGIAIVHQALLETLN